MAIVDQRFVGIPDSLKRCDHGTQIPKEKNKSYKNTASSQQILPGKRDKELCTHEHDQHPIGHKRFPPSFARLGAEKLPCCRQRFPSSSSSLAKVACTRMTTSSLGSSGAIPLSIMPARPLGNPLPHKK